MTMQLNKDYICRYRGVPLSVHSAFFSNDNEVAMKIMLSKKVNVAIILFIEIYTFK